MKVVKPIHPKLVAGGGIGAAVTPALVEFLLRFDITLGTSETVLAAAVIGLLAGHLLPHGD